MKSLQYCANVSRLTAAMAGRQSGIAILAQIPKAPSPSSLAASTSAGGWRRNDQ